MTPKPLLAQLHDICTDIYIPGNALSAGVARQAYLAAIRRERDRCTPDEIAEAYSWAANASFECSDLAGAISDLTQGLNASPGDKLCAILHTHLGVAYNQLERYDLAERSARKAIEHAQRHADPLILRVCQENCDAIGSPGRLEHEYLQNQKPTPRDDHLHN